jgi:hypothetical protein
MITAADVQAVLLGSGGFIGTTMAGVGVYRLCMSGAKKIGEIPKALTSAADELPHLREEIGMLRKAVQDDQSLVCLVTEHGGLLKDIQEGIRDLEKGQELFHRELRVMSRSKEGLSDD